MVRISEIQLFWAFLETFPGNFCPICRCFQIFESFDWMESAQNVAGFWQVTGDVTSEIAEEECERGWRRYTSFRLWTLHSPRRFFSPLLTGFLQALLVDKKTMIAFLLIGRGNCCFDLEPLPEHPYQVFTRSLLFKIWKPRQFSFWVSVNLVS